MKSSFSQGAGDCVEAHRVGDEIHVRDSKHPDGAVLTFTVGQWVSFLAAIRSGMVETHSGAVQVSSGSDGGWVVCHRDDPGGPALRFTPREVTAFVEGVEDGQFDPDVLGRAADGGLRAASGPVTASGVGSVPA